MLFSDQNTYYKHVLELITYRQIKHLCINNIVSSLLITHSKYVHAGGSLAPGESSVEPPMSEHRLRQIVNYFAPDPC